MEIELMENEKCSISEAIDLYFSLKEQIQEYLGYTQGWREIPMDDLRYAYWYLRGADSEIVWSSAKKNLEAYINDEDADEMDIYSAEVYGSRHVKNKICRKDGIVLVAADTNTDGNVFLFVLDAEREVKDAV